MTYGAARLAEKLTATGQPTTRAAVYHWVARRHTPEVPTIQRMISLSRGRLALRDFKKLSPSPRELQHHGKAPQPLSGAGTP